MIAVVGRSARRGLLADRKPSAHDAVRRWQWDILRTLIMDVGPLTR
jgi:hypothetical protein